MGITGLLPFVSGASRKAHVSEWAGCSVAIDAYGWLHRGAFSCADRLARGESTDLHIKYCLKYVSMLVSKNIKPVLVFDGRHLPAKAGTEAKRRESRDIAKKRGAELLRLGQIEEARTFMRRSVDITHEMALQLIRECRERNVDCIVAPYEADAQLAYLNIRNIVQLVITEDSDLILFGCTKVLFKMDLEGSGVLVEASRLPLVMRCPVERYSFDKFRRMCVMSGCDYLPSLPGIGLAKARQFVNSTQDPDFANALKKLPSFLNKSQLVVTDEYRANFLQAEATFKHQFVFDPLSRRMVRLTDPHDEGTDMELCCNAGELLAPETAFQLALGNLDPFTLRRLDNWHPDTSPSVGKFQTTGWKQSGECKHPSMWSSGFEQYTNSEVPWQRRESRGLEAALRGTSGQRRGSARHVTVVPETQDERSDVRLSMWSSGFEQYTKSEVPWQRRESRGLEAALRGTSGQRRGSARHVTVVPETQDERSAVRLSMWSSGFEQYTNSEVLWQRRESRGLEAALRGTSGQRRGSARHVTVVPETQDERSDVRLSMWSSGFEQYTKSEVPWQRRESRGLEAALRGKSGQRRGSAQHVTVVPETQDESLTMESLKSMYCMEPTVKRPKLDVEDLKTSPENSPDSGIALTESSSGSKPSASDTDVLSTSPRRKSPVIVNKNRSFKRAMEKSSYSIMKRLSKFPRTILDEKVVESKFFTVQTVENVKMETDDVVKEEESSSSQKENSLTEAEDGNRSPILGSPCATGRNPFKMKMEKELKPLDEILLSEDSFVENTCPVQAVAALEDSQTSALREDLQPCSAPARLCAAPPPRAGAAPLPPRRAACKAPGLSRRAPPPRLPPGQPTLLGKFGFQKKAVMKH